MNAEQITAYNTMVRRIKAMDGNYLAWSVTMGCCPYEPEHFKGEPIGQFHCPVCGEMILAGFTHPLPGMVTMDGHTFFLSENYPGWLPGE